MFRLRMRKQSWLVLFVFTFLIALLFQYRILSLLKRLGAEVTPIGTRFPFVLDFHHAPQWLLPFYHTLDYLNAVWFTTILGLFIAGAVVAFLPKLLKNRLRGNGLAQQLKLPLSLGVGKGGQVVQGGGVSGHLHHGVGHDQRDRLLMDLNAIFDIEDEKRKAVI